jgi:hypothetical protein
MAFGLRRFVRKPVTKVLRPARAGCASGSWPFERRHWMPSHARYNAPTTARTRDRPGSAASTSDMPRTETST